MELFSQRKGIKPPKSKIQSNSMDDDLRIGLWNALTEYYWNHMLIYDEHGIPPPTYSSIHYELLRRLWESYFKKPLDTLHDDWNTNYKEIRDYFFKCEWNEVYHFIEFVANNFPIEDINQKFMEYCNIVLERESSAYHFVGGKIIQMESEEEIAEIEEAIKVPISPVNEHLNRSLELLSDRKNPDYRNSIKESISAVETLCNLITGDKKETLGKALEKVEKRVALHPALKKAFSHLYGYTSDADGIRHSLMDQQKVSFEDARFMLVICSSFVNYLKAKAEKAGIKL